MSKKQTLIILPCHSIYTLNEPKVSNPLINHELKGPGIDEKGWLLASFQKESQDQLSFLAHLYKAHELLCNDFENSTLIITGGFTKCESPSRSESSSYLKVGQLRGLFNKNKGKDSVLDRVLLEEHARDSYENLLFSFMLYFDKYGTYPDNVIIVGFEFKRFRFLNLHVKILQYPIDKVEYIGIGPTYPDFKYMSSSDLLTYEQYKINEKLFWDDLYQSEDKFAVQLFKDNLFGSKGSKLWDKKNTRDPFNKGAIDHYLKFKGQDTLKHLLIIDGLSKEDAMIYYNDKVKDKFDWCI